MGLFMDWVLKGRNDEKKEIERERDGENFGEGWQREMWERRKQEILE